MNPAEKSKEESSSECRGVEELSLLEGEQEQCGCGREYIRRQRLVGLDHVGPQKPEK